MKILLVEDNKSYSATLRDIIIQLPQKPTVDVAESRSSAIELLDSNFYDIVILDLEIPTVDDTFDLELEHGESVFYHAREHAPGTPVYILTGSEPGTFLRNLVRQGQSVDLWGSGTNIPTVDYYHKEDVVDLFGKIKEITEIVAATDAITINTGGKRIDLSFEQRRTLKVFTRANGGTSCKIHRLGGLSNAVVLKISVHDHLGHVRCECVGKLGLAKHVDKEIAAYEAEVKHLRLGAFAPVLSYHDQGLRGFAGIFYSLADEYKSTFFDIAARDDKKSVEVLCKLRAALGRWSDARNVEATTISEVRRRVLTDESFNNIVKTHNLERLYDFENKNVSIARSCTHGDLHGGNILINETLLPVLIDFGDVGLGFTCLDPLTLELSLIFHPDAIANGISAQLEPLLEHWPDLDKYVENNPFKLIIEYCREWAYDLGPNDNSVIIAAYVFTLRQLKYTTINPETTIKLVDTITKKLQHDN